MYITASCKVLDRNPNSPMQPTTLHSKFEGQEKQIFLVEHCYNSPQLIIANAGGRVFISCCWTQKQEDSNQACIKYCTKHTCKLTISQNDLPATRKGVEGPEWSAKPIAATNKRCTFHCSGQASTQKWPCTPGSRHNL